MTLKETLNKPSCLLTWGREKPFISIKVMFNDFYVSLYLLNLLDSKKSEMDEKKSGYFIDLTMTTIAC